VVGSVGWSVIGGLPSRASAATPTSVACPS
jgi:hypothetical protein